MSSAAANVVPFGPADLVRAEPTTQGTVRVSSGANEMSLDFTGTMTVQTVRERMSEILNLSDDHRPLVNGQHAPGDRALQPGDHVEFMREAGVKG